ncbi:MAG TPA: hypothetical protein VF727_04365 [Allosphingosinicella sp.]|jgi:hypothetical protein
MSLKCFFGLHHPSVSSVARRGERYTGLCDSCARPLEREAVGRWVASEPLDLPREEAKGL